MTTMKPIALMRLTPELSRAEGVGLNELLGLTAQRNSELV
jgi:hypothetical protein